MAAKTNQDALLAKKLASMAGVMKKHGASEGNPEGGRFAGGVEVEFRPTGLPVFDEEVLGIGGVPKGCFLEIYGPKSSGKSALTMYLAGAMQRVDPYLTVKIYDVEASWTDKWGSSMGLDLARVALPEIWGAEKLAEQVHADLASEFPPDIIIIDSIAMLMPEDLQVKEVGDYSMRDQLARAAFLTVFLPSLTNGFYYPRANKDGKLPAGAKLIKLSHTDTTIMCVNHAKQRTNKFTHQPEWYSPGGVALDFASKIQLMVKRTKFEKNGVGEAVTDQLIKITADKNKLAPPKKSCEIKLSFTGGMAQVGTVDYSAMALALNLITIKGGWIYGECLPGGKIQGKVNFNNYVEENAEVKELFVS